MPKSEDDELAEWLFSLKGYDGKPPDLMDYRIAVSELRKKIHKQEAAKDPETRELVTKLRQALRYQNENNAKRNRQLDALHFIWCSGGCKGGSHRYDNGKLTEEIVAEAEAMVKRMRTWLTNNQSKAKK